MANESRWPAAVNRRAMSLGLLLSLLLHVGLLQLFRPHKTIDAAPAAQAAMTLLLLPAAPPLPVSVRALSPAKPVVVQHGSRPDKSSLRANTITPPLPAPPRENSISDMAAIPQSQGKQPRVDLDAALKTARQIATDPASRRNGTAVSQLQTHPLEARPDSRLAQDIQRSARADCLDVGRPFGLLAPLVLAADAVLSKKDGGCKW
ncbi:MAG: hypothetical protein JWQ61_1860 [Collimonas fungivorans]|uniref:hypothetical protein n=1 Tax=Collimonas fungivorans TaxID=158899 RepID=UPI0026EA6A54|nr:hypothetical protein [Collimonas fungivorans]MDB5767046.1 hypothetical protein [Collimonas fungivorans]